MSALKLGSTVWAFGRGDTAEIRRVASETSRSWILDNDQKIPKNHGEDVFDHQGSMYLTRYCLTKEAADTVLMHRMRWKMSNAIQNCMDTAALRAVAAALGMPTSVEST